MKALIYIILLFEILNVKINGTNQTFIPASAWSAFTLENTLNRKDLTRHYIEDCKRDASQNSHIPTANNDRIRIATYNVHLFRPATDALSTPFDYAHHEHFNAIMETIKQINADVLILQEMLIFDWNVIAKAFEYLGYHFSLNSFVQSGTYQDFPFGNMIVSKIKSTKPYLNKTYDMQDVSFFHEHQGFIRAVIDLPNQQELIIYGSHLDVHDNTERVRSQQVQEIIRYAQNETSACVIAADFNAIRAQDYAYAIDTIPVWKLLNDDHKKRNGFDAPTNALALFQEHNFSDCFAKAGLPSPFYSVWNGTLVDFLWLNKQWPFSIDGCYVYYSSLSDHLPIIMDIKLE